MEKGESDEAVAAGSEERLMRMRDVLLPLYLEHLRGERRELDHR